MLVSSSRSMLSKDTFVNIIDRLRIPFRKDKELRSSLRSIIGFYPHSISHYKMALMHKSVMHRNNKGKPVNNERLEFLGDAILDAAIGDIVYRHFPGKREGFLTNTRSKLVQRDTLNKLASELGLCDLILSNGRSSSHNNYMGGNAFEALVGAIYLDRGYNACMRFLKKRILSEMINIDKVAYKEVNFKSKLIEWSQKNKVDIKFENVQQGKDKTGSPTFVYQVLLEGVCGCTGSGFSKKESQQMACKDTLNKLKQQPQFIDEVFAAKAERTKMEEEPVEGLPSIEEPNDFIVISDSSVEDDSKENSSINEQEFSEEESDTEIADEIVDDQPTELDEESDSDELSPESEDYEDIIATAEQQAFSEGNVSENVTSDIPSIVEPKV